MNDLFKDIIEFHNKEKKSVLIVEDNEIESSQIVKMLDRRRHRSDRLPTPGRRHSICSTSKDFDCIILDYTLPDISGTDLVRKVSQQKRKLTPVIVYSAKDFNKDRIEPIKQ